MEERGPWRIRSTETRYENAWVRVDHHDVVTPGGRAGIYGTVHFRNIAIGIIPLSRDLDTWIVGQYRFPHRSYSWEIPEGGGPVGTCPLESAKRELFEETGLVAHEWDVILELDLSNSVTDERALIYVARDLEEVGPPHPEHTEELALRKLPFRSLYEQVLSGLHRDSLTVAGVLKLQLLLQQNLLRRL